MLGGIEKNENEVFFNVICPAKGRKLSLSSMQNSNGENNEKIWVKNLKRNNNEKQKFYCQYASM